MVLKANHRRTSCPCHDEFRGPRSDYVRQNKTQFVRRRDGEKVHSDCETPYKNNDLVSHQWQGYWTSGHG
ncbi:hypothetical protein TNCV_859241 [Trichonephila clavipes]|nr:hypothetical protein TNCV_859241 [Trichonephila clavipes]